MKLLKSLALALGLVVLSSLPMTASASAEVAGVKFDDGYVLGGQPLVLNGAGLRSKMIVKVYAVALYLPEKDRNANGVLAQKGAKSLHIAMLRDVSS
ncbi:MAG: chalcone isomerase family protein, partial [Pseudomonadota bacterium]